MTAAIEEATVLDQELARFFQISKQLFDETGALAMMPTCVVDERWHSLIETNMIDSFVLKCFGGNVEVTHLEAGGVDPLNWVSRYESEFGPLNPVWFTGENGLDVELYNEYTGGTHPDMAWDCTPAFAPTHIKMAWDCTPGFIPKQVKMAWDCTPGFVKRPDAQV